MIDLDRWFSGLATKPEDDEDNPVVKALRLLNPNAGASSAPAAPSAPGSGIPLPAAGGPGDMYRAPLDPNPEAAIPGVPDPFRAIPGVPDPTEPDKTQQNLTPATATVDPDRYDPSWLAPPPVDVSVTGGAQVGAPPYDAGRPLEPEPFGPGLNQGEVVPPPLPYDPNAMAPAPGRFEGPTEGPRLTATIRDPFGVNAGVGGAIASQIPGTEQYEQGIAARQRAAMRRFDDGLAERRAGRIVEQANERVQALADEARSLIAQAPDEASAQQIIDRYTVEIDRVERQAAIDAAELRQAEMRRQEEMAESAARTGRYGRLDRAWDAADRTEIPLTGGATVGSALRGADAFYQRNRNAVASPVTDLAGIEQQGKEAAGDYALVEQALRQYGAPDRMPSAVRERFDAAARRIQAIHAQEPGYSAERNPDTERFRTGVDIAAAAASIPLMPGYGQAANVLRTGTAAQRAGMVGRLAAGTMLDPTGAVIQGGLEAPGALIQGTRAAGRGAAAVGRGLGEAAADAYMGSPLVPRMVEGTGGGATSRIVMRPRGWEAASDEVDALTQPGHYYRGMTEDEYQATFGAGVGVQSRRDFSIAGEGTSFSHQAQDAESYANFGRDDPRKTGRPTYLIEIAGDEGLRLARDGYWKAQAEIPRDRVTRVIRMTPEDGAIVGTDIWTPPQQPRPTNAARVAAADARMAEQGGGTSTYGVMGAVPDARRMYHGTASAFGRPDPGKFDENGLFGPGYYLTSDPRVAGSYAGERARTGMVDGGVLRSYLADIATQTRRTGARGADDLAASFDRAAATVEDGRSYTGDQARRVFSDGAYGAPSVDMTDSQLWGPVRASRQSFTDDLFGPTGANVRAVDVPSGLRLLDIDGPLSPESLQAIGNAAPDSTLAQMVPRWIQSGAAEHMTGNTVYENLFREFNTNGRYPTPADAKRAVNDVMRAAGFDGISHRGGKRVPMMDDAGNPIEHDVTIIFPGSLDRIRNALSGEVGGATFGTLPPGTSPARLGTVNRVLGQGLRQRGEAEALNAGLGAVGGNLMGGTDPFTNPDARPEDVAFNTAWGAAGAVGLRHGARGLARRAGAAAPVPGTRLPGVFGTAMDPGNPLDAMRGRIVPRHVADTLDFPLRIPDDPRAIRAIEAAGGHVVPGKGVDLHVIRNQGPEAHGQIATRGMPFYIAGPPGTPNPYAKATNNVNDVGGTERIEGWTRFRSPLIISGAPGDADGFDDAMRQMAPVEGAEVADARRVYQAAALAREDAWGKNEAAFLRWLEGNPGRYKIHFEGTEEGRRLYDALWDAETAERRAVAVVRKLEDAYRAPTAYEVERGIGEAKRAGPAGSPERAQALKDLVTRYGGDPDLVEPLMAIRGADMGESVYAIKENIVAGNARRNKYDGVVTVQARGPDEAAVSAHPKIVAAAQAIEAANQAYGDARVAAMRAHGIPYPETPEMQAAARAIDDAEAAYGKAQTEVRAELGSDRITELADPREAKNPTPGALHPAVAEIERRVNLARDRLRSLLDATHHSQRTPEQIAEIREARRAVEVGEEHMGLLRNEQSLAPGEPGFTIRSDLPRRPDADTAARALIPGVDPSGAAVGAGLGASSDDDLSPEERAQRAGLGLVGGAVFGRRPANQAARAAPNATMQQIARQMAGQHTPSGITNRRSWAERWAQAWTDDRAGLRTFQEAVSRTLGRPLTAAESVAELTRVNPNSVAHQRLSESLGPALQKVGDDDDYLAQVLVHSHNVDVAREMGQRAYDAAITAGKSPAQASAEAMRAANMRQFSGDLRLAETQQQLQEIEKHVRSLPDGDARWQAIQDGAQAVWDFNRKTLERKRDAGIISDALYQELTSRYPRYVRTDIADYFDKGATGPAPAGRRVGISDIGIQKISAEGTTKERVNPLLSTIEQAYAAEAAIVRNRAGQAFEELVRLDPTWASTFREVVPAQGVNRGNPATTVPSSYTLKNGEQKLTIWQGGQAREFIIPPEYAALVSPQTGRIFGDNWAANAWQATMNAYKSLITSKNPAFSMLVSPLRDAGDYAIREATLSATHGGVRGVAEAVGALPRIMADYAAALPDAFAGITQGQYRGDLARLAREGAGMRGRPGHDQGDLRAALLDLQRTNGLEVRSLGDLGRVVGNVLTLGAEPVGGRLEQVPRLAAARRAARRGADPLGQVMAARDATVDFQRGGEWARAINAAVPFFNVAMQGGAQVARTARANPAAFLASVGATVGTMTVAAEAWNRSDEQRASDYEDVPDYLKKTGVVFMLPGVAGTNERGDRLPNYVWLPVGQYGSLVQMARESIQKTAAGEGGPDLSTPQGWGSLLADVGGTFSPVRGDSAGAMLTSLIPPPLSTAADLVSGKDLFRGSTIATDQRDENASALSQGSAGAFNAVTGAETRASQWEHAYRDLGGYAATLGLAGSNMAAEAAGLRRPREEDRPIQNAPVVGGLVNRLVRDTGGQRLEDAREDRVRVPEGIRPILDEAGVRREEITGVPSKYKGVSLTREEQERWQDVTNSLIAREVAAARRSSEWRERGADKGKIVTGAVGRARELAAERALRRLTDREIERRKRIEEQRKAG